jgi:hypothetical protein
MGMTYEQYWDMSPYLVIAYRKAYKLKRGIANEQAWLQGLYVYDAFAVCMANAFAKRGAKKENYLEKPVDIFPLTDAEKERREQEERDKMQKAMEAIASKQRRKKKQG